MAIFDPKEQRMCVRVVYDGAAGAGKTTNLRQLGSLFAAQRTTEVTSPAELRGRTLYFDWMQIAAGVVCGFPLLCQVISVPGQIAFTERRRHLLLSADVVVYVCDSTKRGAELARDALVVVESLGNAPPIVLQANKQDQVDVLDGKQLATAIGRPHLPVVEAIAPEGIGVVDTFVSAVRTIARTLQERMERTPNSKEGLRIPVKSAPGMKQLLAQVARAPIDPEGAAELLLEEANASLLVGQLTIAEPEHRVKRPATATPAPPTTTAAALIAPLPNADVPTGFIWPAHTGRATLRKLANALVHASSVVVSGADDADGAVERVIDGHVLSTSRGACFAEPEVARQALVRAARERTQLGSLLVSDTVLVVQPAQSDGATSTSSSWLWTVMPVIEPIARWLAGAKGLKLESFASAIVSAIAITHRNSAIQIHQTMRAFGVQNGSIRYHGSLESNPTTTTTTTAHGFLLRIASEVAALGLDVEAFITALERELMRQLDPRDLARIAKESTAEAREEREGASEVARELLHHLFTRIALLDVDDGWQVSTVHPNTPGDVRVVATTL